MTDVADDRAAGIALQFPVTIPSPPSPNDFRIMSTSTPLNEVRDGVLRTPDERFEGLQSFDFEPHYHHVLGYRVHYLDEGPRDADPILLLHGEPTWCYLYRKMIPPLVAAGHRCIAPDLIGFGRSDKPVALETHTYALHVAVMTELVQSLDLTNCTFFGQDWGGLIGLRVVAENPDRFSRVVVSNTGLPTGDKVSEAFQQWQAMSKKMIEKQQFDVGRMMSAMIGDAEIEVAYDAPFPTIQYKAGPLIMPQLVPSSPQDPARDANLQAWQVFANWRKPFLTAFGDSDPITSGGDKIFQRSIPGAQGQPHTTIKDAGHFIQETHAEPLAQIINEFIAATP
jgi:haloalkane dehalogenase